MTRPEKSGATAVRTGDERTLQGVKASESDRAGFVALFDDLSPRVFAYARRQCDLATAHDVVSDTFLVAWRRWSDIPSSPLPWLIVVARNTIANRRRTERREMRLFETVARLEHVAGPAASPDQGVLEREMMLTALAGLTDLEREALLMIAWDGLTNTEAARVAGCSVRAFEVRVSRGRARLHRTMTSSQPESVAGEAVGPLRPNVPGATTLRKAT